MKLLNDTKSNGLICPSFSYVISGDIVRKRIYLKKKIRLNRKYNKVNIIIYIVIAIIISIFLLFKYINKKVSPIILDYAEMESKRLASIVISKSINNELAEELKYNAYYRVKSKFTIDIMIQKYDMLFQSVYEEGENKIYNHLIAEGNNDNNKNTL